MKLLKTPHPIGLIETIYHEDNISKLPILMLFSLLHINKCNKGSQGVR